MRILAELDRTPGAPRQGRAISRTAVRAIILDGQKLLMVFSPVNGDYKFPGGGLDPNENQVQALTREVLEECGAQVTHVGQPFGKIIEYDFAVESEYDIFVMDSYYYFCQVNSTTCSLHLDDYEKELGFQPVWVNIDEAIKTNHAVLASLGKSIPKWTQRDTFILELIKQQVLTGA